MRYLQSPEEPQRVNLCCPHQGTSGHQGDVASPAQSELLPCWATPDTLGCASTPEFPVWELSPGIDLPLMCLLGCSRHGQSCRAPALITEKLLHCSESSGGLDHPHCGSSRKEGLSLHPQLLPHTRSQPFPHKPFSSMPTANWIL